MSSKKKFILFKIIEIILLLTPIITLLCVKSSAWFQTTTALEVSFGVVLSVVVVFFLLKGYAKKINGIIWCALIFFICYWLKSIITDAYMIFGMALLGLVSSYPFKMLAIKNREIAKIVRDEYLKTYARDKATKELKGSDN